MRSTAASSSATDTTTKTSTLAIASNHCNSITPCCCASFLQYTNHPSSSLRMNLTTTTTTSVRITSKDSYRFRHWSFFPGSNAQNGLSYRSPLLNDVFVPLTSSTHHLRKNPCIYIPEHGELPAVSSTKFGGTVHRKFFCLSLFDIVLCCFLKDLR